MVVKVQKGFLQDTYKNLFQDSLEDLSSLHIGAYLSWYVQGTKKIFAAHMEKVSMRKGFSNDIHGKRYEVVRTRETVPHEVCKVFNKKLSRIAKG